MDKADISKQNGDNILRANDIIPPYKSQTGQTGSGSGEFINSKQQSTGRLAAEHAIPRFNLAERILSEQRKATAAKRKAPGINSVIPSRQRERTESVRHAVMPPTTLLFNQHQVIAEIVARDIAQMCRYRMTYA